MTLKLALHGLLTERSTEPETAPAPLEDAPESPAGGGATGPATDPDTVEELAVAMGAHAERATAASEDAEPESDPDPVGELAVAMGGVFNRPAVEHPVAETVLEADPFVEFSLGDAAQQEQFVPEEAEAVDDRQAVPSDSVTSEDVPSAAGSLNGMVVAVVGLRPEGLQSVVALAGADARVIGIDESASRLADIRGGRAQLPSSAREVLRSELSGRGLVLTDRADTLAAAEAVLICVPSPAGRDRRPDSEPLRRACAEVVAHARPGQTLVLTSTTYVGSTRELLVDPLQARGLRVGEDVFVAFCPERSGNETPAGRTDVPRVLGAMSERCYEHASALLRPICPQLHRVSSPQAAEMSKLYESAFRTVNIALAFEMADVCRRHGLDSIEVTEAAASSPSGFMAHYPSAGVGGGAVGVDAHHLTLPRRGGPSPATITADALRRVAARPKQVVWRAQELLARSGIRREDARVLVVGAAYRPGALSTSHAPAVEIITKLAAEGIQVDYHDPLVRELRIDDEMLCGVDPDPRRDASGFGPEDYALAIVVTVHPGYDYGWLRRVPEVLDCTYRTPGGRRRFTP